MPATGVSIYKVILFTAILECPFGTYKQVCYKTACLTLAAGSHVSCLLGLLVAVILSHASCTLLLFSMVTCCTGL